MSLLLQDTLVISPSTVKRIEGEISDVNERVDLIEASSDCADVVGTKAELDSYDKSKLTDQAIIKVLQDESQDNAQTYYRYSKSSNSFTLIGELGPFYTKSESDDLLNSKVNKVSTASKVYGTDTTGAQTTYNVDSFGKVDDVQVNGTSVVTNKIANVTIPDPLPSQTDNAGKFLTTDGTDASWSDKPLVNVSTQNGSLVVGSGSQSFVVDTTAYGVNTIGFGRYASAFGKSAVAKYKATALGANSTANEYTIQLGQGGTNSDAGTMKVALTTSSDVTTNYELLSADGTVPTARLTKVNTTITLTAAGWSNSSQTVNVTGMTADGVVFVNPTPANQSAYTSAGILCTAQAAGSLTFTCDTVPSADITVTVVML